MKLNAVVGLAVICIMVQILSPYAVEAAGLKEAAKDAAKSIVSSAEDAADAVTEVPKTGGVVQTILHKTASVAMDKGVDLLAAKYPIVAAAAPHIKKFSKPMLNAAHSKINGMFKSSDETTTVGPLVDGAGSTTPASEDKKDDKDAPKGGLMDKLKSMVGKKDDDEEKKEEVAAKEEEKPVEEKKEGEQAKPLEKKKRKKNKGKRPNKKPKQNDEQQQATESKPEEEKPAQVENKSESTQEPEADKKEEVSRAKDN